MDVAGRIRNARAFGLGALQQCVNVATTVVPFGPAAWMPPPPGRTLPGWYRQHAGGDVYVPQGAAANRGADLVDRLARRMGLAARPERRELTMAQRPLLASATVRVAGAGGVSRVRFDAAAAAGNDWAARGREAAVVSVYVDDRYHSDVAVLAERAPGYDVILGALALGEHRIDLRAAIDLAGPDARVASVANVVAAVSYGEPALIDRYSPILETRDLGLPGGRAEVGYTDVPLLLVPSIRRLPGGNRTIEYRLLLSNEDGGTNTAGLLRDWGRSTDYEPVYRVTVDARGRKIGEVYHAPNGLSMEPGDGSFQGPNHRYYRFEGRHDGDRPVLRIATGNNNFSPRLRDAGTRWSEAPVAVTGAALTSTELMLQHPWTFAVSSKELMREHKARLTGAFDARRFVGDPRRMLYVAPVGDPVRDSFDARRPVVVRLRDGSSVTVPPRAEPSVNRRQPTTVPLPPSVPLDAVVGVESLRGRVFVLDPAFTPRLLPTVAPAGAAAVPPK